MNKPARITAATITAEIDAATLAIVEALATKKGISAAAFAAEAIQRVAESEADFDAFIQAGIDSADRGELIEQDTMEAWFEERIAARRPK